MVFDDESRYVIARRLRDRSREPLLVRYTPPSDIETIDGVVIYFSATRFDPDDPKQHLVGPRVTVATWFERGGEIEREFTAVLDRAELREILRSIL